VLSATLAAEKAALTGDSPEAVEKNAAEKIRVLETLEKLDQERRALCESPTSSGIAATVVERWRRLMELMAGCRSANEVNGHIIHVRRHQIRQLIDIVRGGPSVTYDPQGKNFAKALRALARA
jgi:flagellar biosynthesis/type III secretory pathway chaperone